MEILKVGDLAPKILLPDENGELFSSEESRGQNLVIFFYPSDDTQTCTVENKDFSNLSAQFAEVHTLVVGISPDDSLSHKKFIRKHGLNLRLLADTKKDIAKSYGVWGPKKMMGREYDGIIRTTFLIDTNGKIAEIWKVSRVKNHAQTVLAAVTNRDTD